MSSEPTLSQTDSTPASEVKDASGPAPVHTDPGPGQRWLARMGQRVGLSADDVLRVVRMVVQGTTMSSIGWQTGFQRSVILTIAGGGWEQAGLLPLVAPEGWPLPLASVVPGKSTRKPRAMVRAPSSASRRAVRPLRGTMPPVTLTVQTFPITQFMRFLSLHGMYTRDQLRALATMTIGQSVTPRELDELLSVMVQRGILAITHPDHYECRSCR